MLKIHAHCYKFIALSFFFLISSAQSYVTVGTDAACDFLPASLQNAINNNVSVRVTNQVTYTPIQIINRHAELLGGFNNCSDAGNLMTGASYTQISGNNNQTVISLSTTAAGGHLARTISLSGIEVHSGSNSGSFLAGGINIIGNITAIINDSIIRNNSATSFGGGVYINGVNGANLRLDKVEIKHNNANEGGGLFASQNAQVTLIDSVISQNTSTSGGAMTLDSSSQMFLENTDILNNSAQTRGGGVDCLGQAELNADDESLIAFNRSEIVGGGLAAQNGCLIKIKSGDNLAAGLSNAGLNQNTAEMLGGGAYLFNATLQLIGNDNHFVNLLNNSTTIMNTGQGGGIYARGDSAHVRVINGRLNLNHSGSGSAIFLTERASLHMRRTSGQCFANQLCSEVANNQADFSGAIMTTQCATADIYQTTFRENNGSLASVLHLEGNGSDECESTFEGNQVFNNQDQGSESNTLFLLDNLVIFDFAYNTITNNLTDRIFELRVNNSSSQTLKINSSLIWNSPAVIVSESAGNHTFSGQCFDVHTFATLPAEFGPQVISQDPVFENPDFNNFQMTQESPTMDYCDISTYWPKHHDIIGVPRGFAWLPPFLGHYDMGAFEYNHINVNDVIFYDRFD